RPCPRPGQGTSRGERPDGLKEGALRASSAFLRTRKRTLARDFCCRMPSRSHMLPADESPSKRQESKQRRVPPPGTIVGDGHKRTPPKRGTIRRKSCP